MINRLMTPVNILKVSRPTSSWWAVNRLRYWIGVRCRLAPPGEDKNHKANIQEYNYATKGAPDDAAHGGT
jgi:hypothetical protein